MTQLPLFGPPQPVEPIPPSPWPATLIPCHACGRPVARTVGVFERLGQRLVCVPHLAPCGLPCAGGGVGSGTRAHWTAPGRGTGGVGCSACGTRPEAA